MSGIGSGSGSGSGGGYRPLTNPNCSRNLPDTLSDLRAQVAANRTGINLVLDLISEYSLKIVQSYMVFIQQNAELAVREMLKQFVKRRGSNVASASDHMDDGTLITLKITIDEETGDTVMDFTGTGCQVLGNTNAPPAVTKSAAIYCLRCLVNDDIPLNQGERAEWGGGGCYKTYTKTKLTKHYPAQVV